MKTSKEGLYKYIERIMLGVKMTTINCIKDGVWLYKNLKDYNFKLDLENQNWEQQQQLSQFCVSFVTNNFREHLFSKHIDIRFWTADIAEFNPAFTLSGEDVL